MHGAVRGLLARLAGVSAVGSFQRPMDVLNLLVSSKPAARALVKLPVWLPPITRWAPHLGRSAVGPPALEIYGCYCQG